MSYPVYTVYSGDVLPILFDSFDGGTGASITMTGLAATDIEIYKDGSATQRASDAGYTLLDTDGIDFDSITGIHGFSIDTGDNTDAGFYAVGSWFHVVVSSITIDGQTVNFIAAAFRIVAAEAIAGVPVVDVKAISGDSTAADNEELMFDGTGYAGGTTKLGVDVVAISGGSTAADNCELDYDGTGYAGGTIVKGADVTKISGDATAADNLEDLFEETAAVGNLIDFVDGTGYAGGTIKLASDATLNATQGSYAPAKASDIPTADITAILADTNELQAELVDGGRTDLLIDGIAAKTTNLPASPAAVGSAMTLADDAITSAKFDESTAFPLKSQDASTTVLARAGDAMSLSATGVAAILDHAVADHLTAGTVGSLIASLGGKMTVVGNQLIVYAANNTTELFRFNLTDAAGDPTMTDVYTRTVTAAP